MRVWGYTLVLGDYIDTDRIIPGRYLHRSDEKWLREHVFEDLPDTREKLDRIPKPIAIVAGKGFSMGSSREHAVLALKAAGVQLIVAQSFYKIFFRNALANTLAAIEASLQDVNDGDIVEADLDTGIIRVNGTPKAKFKPFPPTLKNS